MVRASFRHAGLALALTLTVVSTGSQSAQAADGGAIAAGVIGGVALGALAAGAVHAAPPPPPAYYAPAYQPGSYAPPPPPPRCWREPRQVWDGYGYVVRPVRVCE